MFFGKVFFITEHTQPEPKALGEIIACAGGKVISSVPTPESAPADLIVISCDEDLEQAKQLFGIVEKEKFYVSEYVISAVMVQNIPENPQLHRFDINRDPAAVRLFRKKTLTAAELAKRAKK